MPGTTNGWRATRPAEHWQQTYTQRRPDELSWYEDVPHGSLELVQAAGLPRDAAIIDVGGGTSSLAAHLLDAGYNDVTVIDVSPAALEQAQAQLGDRAAGIEWIVADVRSYDFGRQYDAWHDRAVFHFLVDAADRQGYLDALKRTLRPGGQLLIAAFGPDGPDHCSGLPTARYGAKDLERLLAPEYQLCSSELVIHETPSGAGQEFLYARLRRRSD